MTRVAVILSGCGFLDGSEIYESVLTFLSLDKRGAKYECFAPNINQRKVVNYLTQDNMNETRNVLVESARLARGQIQDLEYANPEEFDALVFPGGFGAALNLCDFAEKGAEYNIHPTVTDFATAMLKAKKPVGFICIAPAMMPKLCEQGVKCTIGEDQQTAEVLESLGAQHENCSARSIVIDENQKVVSTPAYMLGQSISEVAEGIDKLIAAVLEMA